MNRILSLALVALSLVLCSSLTDTPRKPVIFMIGDSTMANKKLDGCNPERGWGQMLPGFLTDEVIVENHAVNGRSTKSFREEGHWEPVEAAIRPGDYVIIEFGHNDTKVDDPKRYTKPGADFDENLRRYIRETRAKGGKPILFNAIARRKFVKDSLVDTHGEYLAATRRVAEEMDVPFVDLNALTAEFIRELGPEASARYFMHIPPGIVPLYPEGKKDNTHLNVAGARRVAAMAVDALAEAVPELAPYVRHYDFVVAKDGSGDFFTVQEAINAVPDHRGRSRTTILIREGEYKEKIIVPRSKINLSLIGQGDVKLTYDDYASKPNIFGEEMGTTGSASFYLYAPDFYAENITFENSAGQVGQAVACFVGGDRAVFRNCRFLGNQDTIYTWIRGRQFYDRCYIEGTVDFIFGRSTALFSDCQIHSKRRGYLTAPSTDSDAAYGYVFLNCRLTADEGVDRVYLSRPWRDYAKAVFIRCDMGAHIHPAGWHNWNRPEREKTAFYAEFANTGEGASTGERASFGHLLDSDAAYTPEKVLAGDDNWNPVAVVAANAVVYP